MVITNPRHQFTPAEDKALLVVIQQLTAQQIAAVLLFLQLRLRPDRAAVIAVLAQLAKP